MPNFITDYIGLGHGELEKYYSLSTEQYCEDQWWLVKHKSIYEVLFINVYWVWLGWSQLPPQQPIRCCALDLWPSVDGTPVFWLLPNSTCTGWRLSLFLLHPAPIPASRFEGGKRLERDRAGTADLSWTKGFSILHDVMPSNEKLGGSVSQDSHYTKTSWASVCSREVASDCLCMTCFSSAFLPY